MAKRKNRRWMQQKTKRTRISSVESGQGSAEEANEKQSTSFDWRVKQEDTVENKVDIIIKDTNNKNYRSLTIWGSGLGVEKTIAVVEALKRNYLRDGTRYLQEASIKAVENDEPHLQVIITLLGTEENSNVDVSVQG